MSRSPSCAGVCRRRGFPTQPPSSAPTMCAPWVRSTWLVHCRSISRQPRLPAARGRRGPHRQATDAASATAGYSARPGILDGATDGFDGISAVRQSDALSVDQHSWRAVDAVLRAALGLQLYATGVL